ncbi:MAG: hypothetical protein JWO40_300 [Candidatus Doudnabacteria bacterium]|nr:hypothetical protein [Candidatus Doudnabacteria bacterium]
MTTKMIEAITMAQAPIQTRAKSLNLVIAPDKQSK